MKNQISKLSSLSVLLLLFSCEGGTTFTKTIDNASSENMTIKLSTVYGHQEEISIHSMESKQIYWDDQMGRFVNDNYLCTESIDSIEITLTNNKTLVKDILNSDNWQRESKDGRNSREDCTFYFNNADLE